MYIPYGFPARQALLSESVVVTIEPLILQEATYLLVVSADSAVLWTTGSTSKRLGGFERSAASVATEGNHVGAAWRPDGTLLALATSKGHVLILSCPSTDIEQSSPLRCLSNRDLSAAVPGSKGGLECVTGGDLAIFLGTPSGQLLAVSWQGAVMAHRDADAPVLPGTPVLTGVSGEPATEVDCSAGPTPTHGDSGLPSESEERAAVVSVAYDVGSHRLVCVVQSGAAIAFAFADEAPS